MNNVFKTFLTVCIMIIALPGMSGEPLDHASFGGAYVTFAGKFGGDVSMKDLKSHDNVSIAGCAAGSQVIRYTLVIRSGKKMTEFQGTSAELSEEMLDELRGLYTGDTFQFRDMQARLPNGGIVDVWGKLFTVTQGPQRS